MSFHIINMVKQLEFRIITFYVLYKYSTVHSLKNDGGFPTNSSSNSEVISTSVEEVLFYSALCLHSFQEEQH